MRHHVTRSIVRLGASVAFFAVLLTGCHTSSASLSKVVGSGKIVTQMRNVEDFHKVKIGSALDAVIVHGDEPSVTVTADDNIVEKIETFIARNGALVVRRVAGLNLQTKNPIKIQIVTPKCDSVVVSGASAVSFRKFEQEELRTRVTGASEFTLDSQIDHFELQASGASKVFADRHESITVDVQLSGASKVAVAAADTIEGSVSGSSSVTYSGDPEHVAIKTSGSSRVRHQKTDS